MGVLKCKPIFYVLRLHDCKYCLLLATQEDARAHTIINVMNVHVLYCDLMDFPYIDIFMRDVFHIQTVRAQPNRQMATFHCSEINVL